MVFLLYSLAVWGSVAWIVGFIIQASDLLASLGVLSSAKDVPLRSKSEKRRVFDNVWTIIGALVLAIVIGLGLELSGRLLLDWDRPLEGWLVVAAVVLVALFGAIAVVAVVIRRDGLSYSVLRANLLEEHSDRIRIEQVAVFRAQLAQIDSRKRHIRFGLRDRAGLRPVRVRLDQVAEDFAVVPPTGFAAVRAIKWKTANAYVWVGNPVRLIPSIFAAVVLVVSIVAIAAGVNVPWPWFAASIVGIGLSFALALLQARVALAAKAAWHAIYQKQRIDAVRLIEELEKSSRKGVAGLGDRVARALQILRDQQN